MEKEGFIYIWFDRKRKMYYIGSHWGTIDDGYICSSNRMRDAYRRRPHDFKRRILKSNIERTVLLEEEHKWLDKIDEKELGVKYYNLRKHRWGHWSTDEDTRNVTISKLKRPMSEETKQKLRIKALEQWKNEDSRKSLSLALKKKYETDEDFRNRQKKVCDSKVGKRLGPRNGIDYSDTWKKEIGLLQKCRTGKGGKYKKIIIDGVVFESVTLAASHHNVVPNTVTSWIKKGKAKVYYE